MTPADLDTLRTTRFDDVAIHDATQVIAYFSYLNRIADALGVEPEDFIQPWGQSQLQAGWTCEGVNNPLKPVKSRLWQN